MQKKAFIVLFIACIIFSQLIFVVAQEQDEDIKLAGLELDKLLALVNGWLALMLAIVAFIAYKRDERQRLLWVGIAFLIFSIKSFLVASELFFPDIGWVDSTAIILEFAVILSFFYGMLKK